eukprot:s573_g31.t1
MAVETHADIFEPGHRDQSLRPRLTGDFEIETFGMELVESYHIAVETKTNELGRADQNTMAVKRTRPAKRPLKSRPTPWTWWSTTAAWLWRPNPMRTYGEAFGIKTYSADLAEHYQYIAVETKTTELGRHADQDLWRGFCGALLPSGREDGDVSLKGGNALQQQDRGVPWQDLARSTDLLELWVGPKPLFEQVQRDLTAAEQVMQVSTNEDLFAIDYEEASKKAGAETDDGKSGSPTVAGMWQQGAWRSAEVSRWDASCKKVHQGQGLKIDKMVRKVILPPKRIPGKRRGDGSLQGAAIVPNSWARQKLCRANHQDCALLVDEVCEETVGKDPSHVTTGFPLSPRKAMDPGRLQHLRVKSGAFIDLKEPLLDQLLETETDLEVFQQLPPEAKGEQRRTEDPVFAKVHQRYDPQEDCQRASHAGHLQHLSPPPVQNQELQAELGQGLLDYGGRNGWRFCKNQENLIFHMRDGSRRFYGTAGGDRRFSEDLEEDEAIVRVTQEILEGDEWVRKTTRRELVINSLESATGRLQKPSRRVTVESKSQRQIRTLKFLDKTLVGCQHKRLHPRYIKRCEKRRRYLQRKAQEARAIGDQ